MRLHKRLGSPLAAVAVAASLGLLGATAAAATPSGSSVLGCRGQYFNTAFSTNCVNAGAAGDFRTRGWCTAQATHAGAWDWVAANETRNGVSPGQCTWQVTSAQTEFSG